MKVNIHMKQKMSPMHIKQKLSTLIENINISALRIINI